MATNQMEILDIPQENRITIGNIIDSPNARSQFKTEIIIQIERLQGIHIIRGSIKIGYFSKENCQLNYQSIS